MKSLKTSKGFTLIELLVVIGIIALLASIAVPAFVGVQVRAAQTKGLSNAKQIGLCCKQFAIDNNGSYPSVSYTTGSGTAQSSNDAFDNLIPTYLQTISIFYQAKSAWTPTQLQDPDMTKISSSNPALPTGANHWAYVTGLYDTSNSSFPLIADGFTDGGDTSHTYTTNETAKGGVWKGQQAIVVFCDDSVKVMKCTVNGTTSTVPSTTAGGGADLFENTSGTGLSSGNKTVNPL